MKASIDLANVLYRHWDQCCPALDSSTHWFSDTTTGQLEERRRSVKGQKLRCCPQNSSCAPTCVCQAPLQAFNATQIKDMHKLLKCCAYLRAAEMKQEKTAARQRMRQVRGANRECLSRAAVRYEGLRIYEQKTHRVGNLGERRNWKLSGMLQHGATEKEAPSSVIESHHRSASETVSRCLEEERPSAPTCIVVARKHVGAAQRRHAQRFSPSKSPHASPWTRARHRQFWQIFMLNSATAAQRLARKTASEEYYCISCQHWQPSLSRGQEKIKKDAQKA